MTQQATTHAKWRESRNIIERIVVEGTLTLTTPAHLGNGDVSVATDLPVYRDSRNGRPILTGSSLAGALRRYLAQIDPGQAEQLFGDVGAGSDAEAIGSALTVEDAYGSATSAEFRDGVAIDSKTRTAEDGKKYDFELIPAGVTFSLRLELACERDERDMLKSALATALKGLEDGAIHLGKRKTRGLGRCNVAIWTVKFYDMGQPADLLAWIKDAAPKETRQGAISVVLGVTAKAAPGGLSLRATFVLDGSSLLIRSAGGSADAPDLVHLRSGGKPIVSGTSLAGALRARALRIANTLGSAKASSFIDGLFGPRLVGRTGKAMAMASRLEVSEVEIINGSTDQVQSRVAIDRFTGGAYPSALFQEQPVFGRPDTRLTMQFDLREPADAEIGLLLLLLKDLWTGDLPLGGESSVGRGRLKGRTAILCCSGREWTLTDTNGTLTVEGDRDGLESFVSVFNKEIAS